MISWFNCSTEPSQAYTVFNVWSVVTGIYSQNINETTIVLCDLDLTLKSLVHFYSMFS